MAIQPMALGVANPEINALSSFSAGQQARQSFDMNNIQIAKAGLETIGSIALGSMGGKIDGQADPALFNQGLDYLAQQGVNVDQFRDRADLAPVIARSSMTALQQLQMAQDEKSYQLALDQFEQAVLQAANPKGVAINDRLVNPQTGELMGDFSDSALGGGPTDLGLNPQYGVDAEGNPVLIQIGKDGKAVQTQLPEGVTLSKEPIRLDAGTHWVLLDPITRQPVGQVAKNNEEAAYLTGFGTAAGKAAAERIAGLPQTLATADNMLGTIDGILNDPALDTATGWLSWMQAVPSTDQYRFGQRALQLQGQSFLQAFESLKGGGQITEVEGTKATQAIGRLSTAQSPEDYRDALNELKGIINDAKSRASQSANAPRIQSPGSAPAVVPDTAASARLVYNPETGELE
jgi:hypothetical protein